MSCSSRSRRCSREAAQTAPASSTITAGPELAPPAPLELLSLARSESHLFLRYGV